MQEIGKVIHDNIISYTPLRNNFIRFFDRILNNEYEFNIDIFLQFLERLPLLRRPLDNRSSWIKAEFENFNFFIHELFLYTIALGLKNENYRFVEEILYSGFFFQDKYNTTSDAPKRYDELYHYLDVIDGYYKKVYSMNFISPMADLIVTRLPENIKKNNLINADLLCHYVSVLEKIKWFPVTYIYGDDIYEFFVRLISHRHFEKVKNLFNVKTVNEFQVMLTDLKKYDENNKKNYRVSYSGTFEYVPYLYEVIDIDKIGSMR